MISPILKPKLQASSIHICLSLLIFAALGAWLYFGLYPSFYFAMSGGIQGLWLMLGVDVVLGPLLTFLVFNLNKKRREIVTDLLVVAAVQLAALGYGVHVVYQERPQLVVLFEDSTATVLNAREVAETSALGEALHTANHHIESVAVTVPTIQNGALTYSNPIDMRTTLTKIDAHSRRFLSADPDKTVLLAELNAIEQQYAGKSVYMISMMGKYTGAYIVLDEQGHYLGKLGEKSVS